MTAKLADFYVTKVVNALYTLATIDDSKNFYYETAPITRTILEDSIDYITDIAGGVKAIVGRRTALAPITKFAGYRLPLTADVASPDSVIPVPSALEDIRRTGWFGQYYGVNNFVALDQVYDNPFDRNPLIKDNLVVVIGNSCGEFITYGDTREDTWTDMTTAPPTWHLRIYQQFGLMFDKMENVAVIRLDKAE
jgi:hypothetical protein